VELWYERRLLRLRVRDDGKGIDPAFLGERVRKGHYGLRGMRERATAIGAELVVWTARESGTEVELSIPASRAYSASLAARQSWLGGRGLSRHSRGTHHE